MRKEPKKTTFLFRGCETNRFVSATTARPFTLYIRWVRVRPQDVTAYYVDMSAAAGGKIAGLRTPTLAVSSLDDPIMTADGSPVADLKNIEGLFILLTR